MPHTTVHIINHTHWDREWFLTSIYTSQWIPGLVDKLEGLVADNPDFRFFLDGQTLVVEDLLRVAPAYRKKVDRLVRNGNLIIGPYYCQPDWRLTGGEALIRNLLYGWQDVKQFGGTGETGWLVDTFGHISQAPQLHRLFGVKAVYVWRGVPQLEPYFHWQGADGGQLFTINLFGGYRNLYGVTHTPDVAVKRLRTEVHKLQPFYPTVDIPLFDGYDLEDDPEDPLRFFQQRPSAIPPDFRLRESTPGDFAKTVSYELQNPPTIRGELNSGKYGAVFPGTLSTRAYLKIMGRDCEHLLYQLCEPLAVLARLKGRAYPVRQYEAWGRALLQNVVHDCICGVSIDQVHEKMEFTYRELFESLQADIHDSLTHIFEDFVPGTYAVSTNSSTYEGWQMVQDALCHVQTDGVGVWPISEVALVEQPLETVQSFEWQNSHYTASVRADGVVRIGEATLGYLQVSEENGDTYSDEKGPQRGVCLPRGPLVIEQKSAFHCVLSYACDLAWDDGHVSATVHLFLDQTPLVRWQVDLDSRGADFRVDMVFETAQRGQVYAGMPFDVVQRPTIDRDLLPRQLETGLAHPLDRVLLGQRELVAVKTFPFHDFVALSDGTSTAVVFARGVHSYQADLSGCITITLRRAVEWLTKADLEYRVGDAGPFFYVPDARCERTVRHELAVLIGKAGVDDLTMHQLNAGFQNPPLIVQSVGSGERTEWRLLRENLPLSSLCLSDGRMLARFFNPTTKACALEREYLKTDVWGQPEAFINAVSSKEIVTVDIQEPFPALQPLPERTVITTSTGPTWRVGGNQGLPDPQIIRQLKAQVAQLERRLRQMEQRLSRATESDRHLLQHRYYVIGRELYELRLSLLLNQLKLTMQGQLSYVYLYTPDDGVAAIGLQLNRLRIKRRIYDYVVQAV
jgi:alpha-mannosidase